MSKVEKIALLAFLVFLIVILSLIWIDIAPAITEIGMR